MNYRNYQNARDMSWRIIIQEGITKLPVDVVSLCKQMGVRVKRFTPPNGNDGSCTIIGSVPYIFVSPKCSPQRQRFTIAHELGHILMGHVGKYKLVNREPSSDDSPIEQEANVFASRLLAPACVLWGCKIRNAEEIAALCNISRQSAEFRMERMQELYKINKFLTSPLERKVYIQFEDFILNHRHLVDF